MSCKYPVFLAMASILALSHISLAALPDDALKSREQNAVHFLLEVKNTTLTKLATPNGNGNAVCHISGKILELYALGNSTSTNQLVTGNDVQFDVACSDADYPVAPGGFGLSKSEANASRLELWGEVEHSYGTEALSFHPFKAAVR